MADDASRRERIERALDGARGWVQRGGQGVGKTLGRGVRAGYERASERVREAAGAGDGRGEAQSAPNATGEAAADPAGFFSRERQREAEQLGHANIIVTGQTGVGKSTLINAIFRKRLADESIGRPVTQHVQRHDVSGVPVTIYDTPGIELGDSKDAVIREFKKTIRQSRKASPHDLIHVLWYCIDAGQTRVQDYDTEIVRALAQEIPVILVFTQCIDDERADALEQTIAEANLPIVDAHPVRTLARPRNVGGTTIEPRGLEELVRLTHRILPEAVRRAFTNAQGVVIALKVDQARAIVATSSALAAGIGAAPIPVSDAVVLLPVQLGMLAGITAVFGVDMSTDSATKLIRGLVGQGGVSAVGKPMAARLLKVLPGASLINAAVAGALTAALGEAYIQLCREMLGRQAAGKPMADREMLSFVLDVYEKTFKLPARRAQAKLSRAAARGR